MKLFGHDTSPYVRRVRALLHELEVPFERDTHGWQDPSPDFLRVSPCARVPAMSVQQPAGELVILDSRTIADYLLTHHAPPVTSGTTLPFQPTLVHVAHRYEDENVLTLINAALDGGIQLFMSRIDGTVPANAPILQRQARRIENCLAAVDKVYAGRSSLHDDAFGFIDLALACSVDWFGFREVHDISKYANLASFFEQNRERRSLATTDPRRAT
jgi:glutathione S-transferase